MNLFSIFYQSTEQILAGTWWGPRRRSPPWAGGCGDVEGKIMLSGKKTYLMAVLLGVASFALAMGWLDRDQFELIAGFLGSLGLAALRAGVNKAGS